jgi:hypothetical protein
MRYLCVNDAQYIYEFIHFPRSCKKKNAFLTRVASFSWIQMLNPKLQPVPYGPWSNAVHHVGNRVLFGMHTDDVHLSF